MGISVGEIIGGVLSFTAGVGLDLTGVGILGGLALNAQGALMVVHGGTAVVVTAKNFYDDFNILYAKIGEGTSKAAKLSPDALKKIGTQAENSGIRAVKGKADDALTFFKNQVNPSTIKEVKPGVFVGQDTNGLSFTFRAASKSWPPTIDVNGINGLRKIKFLE